MNGMKSGLHVPICLLLLLACLVSVGTWSARKLDSEAGVLLDITDRIRRSLEERNYEQAQYGCDLLIAQWEEYYPHWTMLINHQEMDHIFESVNKLRQFLRFRDDVDSWAELDTLVHFIHHVPEKESLSIQNLL
ncbi:MAG: DUF4363 family protein [Peptococcaceae bacterium]|jgi:hypothetical protein|nr:DUF4363 family protein [Peptococcaceae bacterium]